MTIDGPKTPSKTDYLSTHADTHQMTKSMNINKTDLRDKVI